MFDNSTGVIDDDMRVCWESWGVGAVCGCGSGSCCCWCWCVVKFKEKEEEESL